MWPRWRLWVRTKPWLLSAWCICALTVAVSQVLTSAKTSMVSAGAKFVLQTQPRRQEVLLWTTARATPASSASRAPMAAHARQPACRVPFSFSQTQVESAQPACRVPIRLRRGRRRARRAAAQPGRFEMDVDRSSQVSVRLVQPARRVKTVSDVKAT